MAHEQAQAGQATSADPAAQLVELGDTEPVGVEQHHGGGVGDVDADLDDGGGDEHVDLAPGEGAHGAVLLLRRQPPVQQPDAQPGERALGQLGGDLLDGGERTLRPGLPLHGGGIALPLLGDVAGDAHTT